MRHPLAMVYLAAAVACCAGPAAAETSIALYSGTSDTADSNVHISQPSAGSDANFHNVSWQARPFEDSPYYGIRVTYFPTGSSRLGGSLDFTHYKIVADTGRILAVDGVWNGVAVSGSQPMNLHLQQFEVSHGVNLLALNLMYRWPLGRGATLPGAHWQLYAGAGPVVYVPHAEATIDGSFTAAGYRVAGYGYQVLAGVQCKVWRRVRLFAEVKQDNGDLDLHFGGDTRAKTRVRTMHALAGIAVGLGHADAAAGQ